MSWDPEDTNRHLDDKTGDIEDINLEDRGQDVHGGEFSYEGDEKLTESARAGDLFDNSGMLRDPSDREY